jgi:lipopolysaccharide biosynthesis glycosyltransferase
MTCRCSTPRSAVMYVTDLHFMLPTLVSAMAVRKWVGRDKADVRIVSIDLPGDIEEQVQRFLAPFSIQLDRMDGARLDDFDPRKFNKTHVPKSTLGRFFMLDCADAKYDHVVYIDGDTWIQSDPTPLIEYRPPEGLIAAAEDISFFMQGDLGPNGEATRAYFAGLGIDGRKGYFNAGVLTASSATWRELSREAYRFFIENTAKCRYHDQSALNVVAQGRRVRLSPRWNFTTPYRYWDVEADVTPAIYHFSGAAKPWMGRFDPWLDICDQYVPAVAELDGLRLPTKTAPPGSIAAEHRRSQNQRLRLQTVMLPRTLLRRRTFRRVASSSVLNAS